MLRLFCVWFFCRVNSCGKSSVIVVAQHNISTAQRTPAKLTYNSTTPGTTGKRTNPTASSRHTRGTDVRCDSVCFAFLVFLAKRFVWVCLFGDLAGEVRSFVCSATHKPHLDKRHTRPPARELSPGAIGDLVVSTYDLHLLTLEACAVPNAETYIASGVAKSSFRLILIYLECEIEFNFA